MEAVEAVLAAIEAARRKAAGAPAVRAVAASVPAAAAPPSAAAMRAQQAARAASVARAPLRESASAPRRPLVALRDPHDIIRAVIASEVLAPPVALREER